MEKELITIMGRAETPGRPILYGTTKTFLKVLGLNALEDLPKLKEINEILKDQEIEGITQADIDLFNSFNDNELGKDSGHQLELISSSETEDISSDDPGTSESSNIIEIEDFTDDEADNNEQLANDETLNESDSYEVEEKIYNKMNDEYGELKDNSDPGIIEDSDDDHRNIEPEENHSEQNNLDSDINSDTDIESNENESK